MIFIDEDTWPPSLHGTGSEDYFNHAWGMQDNAFLMNGSALHESVDGSITPYTKERFERIQAGKLAPNDESQKKAQFRYNRAIMIITDWLSVYFHAAEKGEADLAEYLMDAAFRRLISRFVVGIFWHGYESVWLPAQLLQIGEQMPLVDALCVASRHWNVSLHFNKGLAGAPAEAIEAARESNFFERSWQQSFWGSNYSKLQAVKAKYDPTGLFFVHHGVGSEGWSADGFTRLT